MGMIDITIRGSFSKPGTKTFTAMAGGHAKAVAQAIQHLSAEVLPAAIELDHQLQAEGEYPKDRFGLPDPRQERPNS